MKKRSKDKVKRKIYLAGMSILIALIILVYALINVVNKSVNIATTLYEHPFTIINALSNLSLDSQILHEKYNASFREDKTLLLEEYKENVEAYSSHINENIAIIRKNYLGAPSSVDQLASDFESYQNELMERSSEKTHDLQLHALTESIFTIKSFAINKASELKIEAEHRAATLYNLSALTIGITLFYSLFMTRYIYLILLANERELQKLRYNIEQSGLIAEEKSNTLHKVVRLAPIPIMLHAENGEVILLSHTFEKLSGYKQDELPTIDTWTKKAYGQKETSPKAVISKLYDIEGSQHDGEFVVKCKDGLDAIWDFYSAFIGYTSDGRRLVMSVALDVTQRIRDENDLVTARDLANEANHAKSQFLATMSHEIRTPINGIMGMMQLLELTDISEEQRDYIKVSKTSSEILLNVINDILDYSKLEAEKMQLEQTAFLLSDVVTEVVDIVKYSAKNKQTQIKINIDKDIPKSLIGDAFRLRQVILNIVGNAVKYTSSGNIDIFVIKIPSSVNSKIQLKFIVKDTGIGIEKEKLKYIFDNFTQVDSSNTRQFGGTGLGLSIARKLVTLMNGTIGVESEKGVGSTFWFTGSFNTSPKPSLTSALQRDAIEPDTVKSVHILVAEDDEINRIFLKKVLEKKNWRATFVDNGIDAVSRAENEIFDLILMDIQMPRLNGYEATRNIKDNTSSINRETPIIALTAFSFKEDQEKCLDAGMEDYLSKPINIDVLYAKIIQYLNK